MAAVVVEKERAEWFPCQANATCQEQGEMKKMGRVGEVHARALVGTAPKALPGGVSSPEMQTQEQTKAGLLYS